MRPTYLFPTGAHKDILRTFRANAAIKCALIGNAVFIAPEPLKIRAANANIPRARFIIDYDDVFNQCV